MGFMPPEAVTIIAGQMLSIGDPRFGDYLALLVLDEREGIAITIADLLADHPHCITPLTLDRMVRVRNWLSGNVQKSVDKLIRNARKKIPQGGSVIPSSTGYPGLDEHGGWQWCPGRDVDGEGPSGW